MRKRLLLGTLLLGAPLSAQSVSMELGAFSRYVWRGQSQTTMPVIQLGLSVAWGPASVGIWNNRTARRSTETDVWAEVGGERFSAGWMTYDFADHELYANAALGPVRLYASADLGGAGLYVQPAVVLSVRGTEVMVGYGFGQGLDHAEAAVSRAFSLGSIIIAPSIAARSGLVWGGVLITWETQ